jgi:hypothetical protein
MQQNFQFVPDWHLNPKLKGTIESYTCLLFSILKEKPKLTDCLVRCKHCGIYFITYYSNKNRKDLGCPFGCRQTHRKKSAARRSVEFYETAKGKTKKKLLNKGRSLIGTKQQSEAKQAKPKDRDFSISSRVHIERNFMSYLRMLIRLIEGRRVDLKDIISLVDTILRQRSLDIMAKTRYFRKKIGSRSP